MNEERCTLAVYTDLKKAFDTVNHSILIRKLYNLGIRCKILDWITNYLTDRGQRTLANDTISTSRNVVCGAPQGSILGLLLFICHINDLSYVFSNSSNMLYADDTVMYVHADSIDTAHNLLVYHVKQKSRAIKID